MKGLNKDFAENGFQCSNAPKRSKSTNKDKEAKKVILKIQILTWICLIRFRTQNMKNLIASSKWMTN